MSLTLGILGDVTATDERSIFFFNDTATTEIYTLSLHDALPILFTSSAVQGILQLPLEVIPRTVYRSTARPWRYAPMMLDRKSTRLNSSHANISYAVFCLKKKQHLSYAFFCLHNISHHLHTQLLF